MFKIVIAVKRAFTSVKRSAGYRRFRQFRGSLKLAVALAYGRYKRRRSRATFVAITGSSAKTTTTALLSHILSETRSVKAQLGRNGLGDACRALRSVTNGVEFVVLEFGTGGAGDIERLATVVRPHVAIVTLVELQHYAAFRSKEAIAKEKAALVRALGADGLAILNKDDPLVLAMSDDTQARVITFGTAGADYAQHNACSTGLGKLSFDLDHRGRRIRLETCLSGVHNTVAVSAAAACALELGVPEHVVASRIASFQPVFGRQSVHKITGGPLFILDTMKAPYESITLCLDVLKSCSAPRKRFVLGTISDYAGAPVPKYRSIYQAAQECADQVIFVGPHAKKSRASREDVEKGTFVAFASVQEASSYIKSTAMPGEVILIKGSSNLHLERVMLDSSTEVGCWPDACGIDINCHDCGLYARPFAEHGGKAKST